MNFKLGFVFIFWIFSTSYAIILRSFSLDTIQFFNLRMLNSSLQIGWKHFCHADVDEGVMSFFPEFSPSSVEILLRTEQNETISFSVKDLPDLLDFGFDTQKRTLLIISGVSDPRTIDVRSNLRYLQQKLTHFNIIIVDFGANILQLYNTIKRSVQINAFLVSKILGELKKAGISMESVTLIGHSVGANIAALGAEIFTDESNGKKLPLLIAIDPALMCSKEDIYVNPSVCRKVVVIHGENSVLSVREDIGTIDIYPNGDEGMHQPGCSTSLCDHMYPLMLFIRTLIDDTEVLAVKCKDWSAFRRGKCNFNDSLKVGLTYDRRFRGKYYSLAEKCPPYDRETIHRTQIEFVDKVMDPMPLPLDVYANLDFEPVVLK